MAARLALGGDPRERLRRLAVLFAVELRLKIVAELYMREMSAKQFYLEFGGGSVARVSQNFIRLVEAGWLRFVRTLPAGGARHGAAEHIYRATEPAYFDAETWALVPYSLRTASSWNIYKQVAPRLRASIEGMSDEADWMRALTCEQWVLDSIGWQRVIEALDGFFQTIFEVQQDSRVRAEHGEGVLRPADVFVIAFESAGSYSTPQGIDLVEQHIEPLAPFGARLAPVLRDDVLLEIAAELNRREVSPTQFHREIGGANRKEIWTRFRGFERYGWSALVRKERGGRRRGGTEHFYRATKPAYSDYDACAEPLSSVKKSEAWQAFEEFCADAVGSMKAGVFDARTDRYVTWSNIVLDECGWETVLAGLEELRSFISKEEQQSRKRIKKSGEAPKTMTAGLAAMETVPGPKAP